MGVSASKHLAPLDASTTSISRRGKKNAKPTRYTQIGGYSGTRAFVVFNNSRHNLERGIMERVKLCKIEGAFVMPPVPEDMFVEFYHNIAHRDLHPHLTASVPITFDQFIGKYNGKKLARYNKAKEDTLHHPKLTKRDLRITAFTKKEMLPIKENKPFSEMIPRIVQARSPKFNLSFGCYIDACEKRIYQAIDKMFNKITGSQQEMKTVMKGLNSKEQADQIIKKWSRFSKPVFIPLDAKRFDQCCNKPLLGTLHGSITKCFPNRRHKRKLRWMLDQTVKNNCVGKAKDGLVKYKTDGGLNSGEMTTSLTGVYIMCLAIYTYLVYWVKLAKFEVIDAGDDAGIIMEQDELYRLDDLSEIFLKFGLRMTIGKPVYVLEEIEFCSTQPVYDGSEWRMVRDPRVTSTKDAHSLKPLGSKTELANYLNSIGKGGLSLTGGIPMLQSYYLSMIRNATLLSGNKTLKDVKLEGGLYYLSKRMNEKQRAVTDEARSSFYKAFGILPDLQIEMEKQYDNLIVDWCSVRCYKQQPYNLFETK